MNDEFIITKNKLPEWGTCVIGVTGFTNSMFPICSAFFYHGKDEWIECGSSEIYKTNQIFLWAPMLKRPSDFFIFNEKRDAANDILKDEEIKVLPLSELPKE